MRENSYEGIAPSVFEVHFEVTVARKQILVGRTAALQVVGTEDGHFHFFVEQISDGDVEGVELLLWLLRHENNSQRCQVALD